MLIRRTAVGVQPAPSSQRVTAIDRLAVEVVAAPVAIKVIFDLHDRRQFSGDYEVAQSFDQLPPPLAIKVLHVPAHPAKHGWQIWFSAGTKQSANGLPVQLRCLEEFLVALLRHLAPMGDVERLQVCMPIMSSSVSEYCPSARASQSLLRQRVRMRILYQSTATSSSHSLSQGTRMSPSVHPGSLSVP